MRTCLLLGLSTLLFSACTTLGSDDGTVSRNVGSGSGSGSGSCEVVPSGASCATDADCDDLEECEHGACILDRSDACDDEHPQGTACTTDADCGSGLECEHGACAPHGGGGDDD